MRKFDPLQVLLGYRLGGRQATVELQAEGVPGIHIDFDVLRLIDAVEQGRCRSIILTGTAGDGKTYIAYRIMEALSLDRTAVSAAQRSGGYEDGGAFIDLDLSAGSLDLERAKRIHARLLEPTRLALVCANEGKLTELERLWRTLDLSRPPGCLYVNLSHRAVVCQGAWEKTLSGFLSGPLWDLGEPLAEGSPQAWNRAWLADPSIAERLRKYLLLPYLLGAPITIRELLSFLAYALAGGLDGAGVARLPAEQRIRYLLFNTVWSEPDNYVHGGRALPTEKLLWWTFRFDPADHASAAVDLKLLTELDQLDVCPPQDLLDLWRADLIVRGDERSDAGYRKRLSRFMGYARRWYALASENGFRAYFPLRFFHAYIEDLGASSEMLGGRVSSLVRGLNLLLSGGLVDNDDELFVYYLPADETRSHAPIYSPNALIETSDLVLESDFMDAADSRDAVAEAFLEHMPRRIYLRYGSEPAVRLPVSLLLYEVLQSAATRAGAFPATLWSRERDAVLRFMSRLARVVQPLGQARKFNILLPDKQLELKHYPDRLRVS